jgi:hypothetical protein
MILERLCPVEVSARDQVSMAQRHPHFVTRRRCVIVHRGGSFSVLNCPIQQIDNLKKENFNIKLRVHFLEERLAQLAPDQVDGALKQNIQLKIEVHERGRDLKKMRKVVSELEKELESNGRLLEDRDRELRELRRRRGGSGIPDDGVQLRELREENAQLQAELEETREVLQEHMDEKERMEAILERNGDASLMAEGGEARREKLKRRINELELANEDLQVTVQEQERVITQKEEEREDLLDEIEALRLDMEEIQRRREAESMERSESRAQMMEERDAREAVEEDLNAIRDRLAAASIELQQKEDDLEAKNREIEELVAEHERIVGVIDQEWRGEVEEAKNQCEELKDVSAISTFICHG